MKRTAFFLFPLLFLFIASAIYGFRSAELSNQKDVKPTPPDISTNYIKDEVFTEPPVKFKISSYRGNIALFQIKSGKEILMEQYDTPLSSLREWDASLLKQGIYFDSQKEAAETLENFIN